jgi:hypothetical protein
VTSTQELLRTSMFQDRRQPASYVLEILINLAPRVEDLLAGRPRYDALRMRRLNYDWLIAASQQIQGQGGDLRSL